ncbi:MAG: hypothetical protein BroJett040_06920 [Oligoflexia bacterium]|nr:MAG: hypothetical protein BroJett040_06920 [Oligoflexia bacterium]
MQNKISIMTMIVVVGLFCGLTNIGHAETLPPSPQKIKSQEYLNLIYQNLSLSEPLQQVTMIPQSPDDSEGTNLSRQRELHTIAFQHENVGTFKITVNGPKGFLDSNKKYPLLFVTSGFQTGAKTALLFHTRQDLIVVGYEYPSNISQIAKDPSLMLKTIRVVPGQIALSLKFLSEQKWVESRQLSALGISLGGLFLPVSLKLAEKIQVSVQSTIFAYTGTQIQSIIEYSMGKYLDENIRSLFGQLLQNILTLHDPSVHAPELTGRFLVIQGTQDQVFPTESTQSLFDLLPEKKELVKIEGEHIDLGRDKLIQQTIQVIENWLKKVN